MSWTNVGYGVASVALAVFVIVTLVLLSKKEGPSEPKVLKLPGGSCVYEHGNTVIEVHCPGPEAP